MDNRAGPGLPTIVNDEIIEFVAERMASRVRKHALRKELEEIYGARIAHSTYEELRRKARILIEQQAGVSGFVHQQNGVAFLETIIADDDASPRDKIFAQRELNEMLGLGARFSKADTENVGKDIRKFLEETDECCGEEIPEEKTTD